MKMLVVGAGAAVATGAAVSLLFGAGVAAAVEPVEHSGLVFRADAGPVSVTSMRMCRSPAGVAVSRTSRTLALTVARVAAGSPSQSGK